MFSKAIFANVSRKVIVATMEKDGFTPKLIIDKPDYIYTPHKHPEIKYLVCLKGSMKVTVNGKLFNFEPGDKLIIPGNTIHEGVVSNEGCMYFWSEKLVNKND